MKKIYEDLREGYIGKEVFDKDGVKYIQVTRGKPYGKLVASFDEEKNEINFGFSVIDKYDTYDKHIAKKLADERLGTEFIVPSKIKTQFEHFQKRAMKYFQRDIYSHKGTDPIPEEKFYDRKCYAFVTELLSNSKEKLFETLYKMHLKNKE